MSMAIDREAFINTIQGGKGEILNAEIHSGHTETFYTPLEKMPKEVQENFSYNPELARQLLAEAGYPNGFETTIQANARSLSEMWCLFWQLCGRISESTLKLICGMRLF